MPPVRVLVVDDSSVARKLLREMLEEDPEIEVVGTAAHGGIALAKIAQLAPDVVTLDFAMPEMDGIETLTALRREHPDLPVIMCSSTTERGATLTLEALSRGATDYVTKPSTTSAAGDASAQLGAKLRPKVRALGFGWQRRGLEPTHARSDTPARTASLAGAAPRSTTRRRELVVIGISTGGPNALERLVAALPASLPAPVAIVQHMPPMFTALLARRLDGVTSLSVREAEEGSVLERGSVWIAPGGSHIVVRRAGDKAVLSLCQGPEENSCRPAADVLFRTAADTFGDGVLGVVMTGMGHDGTRGAQAIVEAGGIVLAQDEATSVVWGMPGAVCSAGLAARVLPLDELATAIDGEVRGVPVALQGVDRGDH